MKIAYLVLIFGVLATSADAQTVAFTFDLSQWRAPIVGVPLAVETDDNPATAEWLLRVKDLTPPEAAETWSSVVLQIRPEGVCAGTSFHRTAAPETADRLVSPRLWMVRDGDVLTTYALTTPRCEGQH